MITSFFKPAGSPKRKRKASTRAAAAAASDTPRQARKRARAQVDGETKVVRVEDGEEEEETVAPPEAAAAAAAPAEGSGGAKEEEEEEERGMRVVKVAGVDIEIHSTWAKVLKKQFRLPYFKDLQKFVAAERKAKTIFPPPEKVYSAFNLTPLDRVRVVICGQDPYHDHNQANGLCFSVSKGVRIPPSLRNMIKEAVSDVGITAPTHGSLECWARQGVFLLNNVLTVRAHKANSHRRQGWEKFTEAVIKEINKQPHVVFMLWGKPAQKKEKWLNKSKHLILKSAHPSPLSAHRGFFGCKHFSKANKWLQKKGYNGIDWAIDEE